MKCCPAPAVLLARCSISALALAVTAGMATAQSDNPWDGIYAGVNAGGASNSTCHSWMPSGNTIDPAMVTAFGNRYCPNGGTFVGGVQIGDNFQYKRLFWGIGADFDVWTARSQNQSLKYTGAALPTGAYAFSDKLGPDGFAAIGPRIGYAGHQLLTYLRVGAMFPVGPDKSTFSYTPAGAAKPIASFSGGRNFASTGWVAGGGAEWGLNGPWSITAEYLHANLGKGADATATCTGSAAACAAFSGISFESIHTGFSANIFRVGINYWFGYWEP